MGGCSEEISKIYRNILTYPVGESAKPRTSSLLGGEGVILRAMEGVRIREATMAAPWNILGGQLWQL